MSQEISASLQRKLQTNLILRVALAAAFVCLWASPLLIRAIYAGPIGTGQLYAITFTDFCFISLSLAGGFFALQFTKRRLLSGKTENVERKLKVNLILRVVLAVAFVSVWSLPLLFRAMFGKVIPVGDLYASTVGGFLTASLPLLGGILALQFTRKRILRESSEPSLAASATALEA
jgi:hypothetical protein